MKQKKALTPGSLLISKPLIGDGFFEQSVVYLTNHTEEGSLGFTLNKEANLRAQDFIEGLNGIDPIFFGGPVEQDGLFFLHNYDALPGASAVGNGLYLGGDFELFQQMFRDTRASQRPLTPPKLFLGYSGWSPGQLEEEISNDTWIVIAPPLTINPLKADMNAWREMMIKLGGEYKFWANAPEDPWMN